MGFCIPKIDWQQLKHTSSRSAGHPVACNDFILTAYMLSMTWGAWHIIIGTWAERWRPWAGRRGSGRRTHNVLES